MDNTEMFFLDCQEEWREGYLIPVRNRLGEMIEREFLPIEFKDAFIQEFGEKVIYDDQFTDWYCEVRKESLRKYQS